MDEMFADLSASGIRINAISAGPIRTLAASLERGSEHPIATAVVKGAEARGIAIYRGEFRAGQKHGKGVKTWPSTGDRYEGDFVEDRKEGVGTYTWGRRSTSPGEKYTGEWLRDQRHGNGVYEWPSGEARDVWLPGLPSRVLAANPEFRMRRLAPAQVAEAVWLSRGHTEANRSSARSVVLEAH